MAQIQSISIFEWAVFIWVKLKLRSKNQFDFFFWLSFKDKYHQMASWVLNRLPLFYFAYKAWIRHTNINSYTALMYGCIKRGECEVMWRLGARCNTARTRDSDFQPREWFGSVGNCIPGPQGTCWQLILPMSHVKYAHVQCASRLMKTALLT